MKKKNEIIAILGSDKLPPPATQPIAGGIAPTKEPGIIANAVFFLSGV